VVFVDESAESVAALDFVSGRKPGGSGRLGWQERESAVRPLAVVMLGIDT